MKHIGDANGADGATAVAAFKYHDAYADHRSGDATAAVPDSSLLFSGTYHQSGQDLIITKPFETVTIHDYFRYDVKPALVAPDGSSLSATVVLALTEGRPWPQYAGDEPARVTAIGRVETATGTATVIRNGQSIILHAGDLVFKGDAVETGEHGALAITFIDGTTFTLAESARMVLNDMVYQPGGSNNSSLLSLVQGSITFVAGEVAHTGEMKVDTPVATMGIRGTAVHVNISAHDGPTRFSVMREPDGRVGSYILYDHKDGSQLATVSEVGNVVELQLNDGQIIINTTPKTPLDFQQEQALTQQVFATFQAGQQDSLLRSLMQTHDPSAGGSHGSSGPPQTGPSGGQSEGPSGNQPSQGTPNQTTPQPFQSTPSPPHPAGDGQPPPLPILAPVPAPTAPVETIILAKNAAIDTILPISAETIVGIQASNGSFTPVGAQGTTIRGLYGDLTISADGSLHYAADHAQSLFAHDSGFDIFSYTVANSNGVTASSTLTFDVIGANEPPALTVPAAETITAGQTAAISGVAVSETGNTNGETFTVTVTGQHGNLSVTGSGGAVSGSGTTSLSITGTLDQVNAYLAALKVTEATPGTDTITLNTNDSYGNNAVQQTISVTANGSGGTNWSGDTLQEYYHYVDGGYTWNGGTFVVPASGINGNAGIFYLSIGTDSITASFPNSCDNYWLPSTSMNGFEIIDVSGNPEISGVTIDPSTNMAGFDLNRISFNSDEIWVNWQGLSFDSSTIVKLNLTFDPPLDPSQMSVAQTLDGSLSPVLNKTSLSVDDGTALMLIGTVANFGTISVNGAHASTAIGIDGSVTLEGSGHIVLSQSNENYIFGSGTLTNADNIVSGGGDIGNGTLVIHNAGTIEAEGPYALIVDTGSNPLVNTGLLETNGGTLIADSPVTGGGHAIINGGTLEFTSVSDNDLSFTSSGMLALDRSQHFTGTISGFTSQDQIDLGDIAFSANAALSYVTNGSNGGTLSVNDGAHIASIALLGAYAASDFALASDGHGGTLVTTDPAINDATSNGAVSAAASRPVLSGVIASVQSDGGNGDFVALTGQVSGSDDTGTIAWDQGGTATPLAFTNGAFSISQDLTPGDHLATLTLNDAAANAKAVQTIDIDIGGSDAPFVFASATSPAVLIGSASANASQTLTGSAAYQDTIVAGAGNDTLTGNYTGGDTFVFKQNMGNDQITDLHTAGLNGTHDTIDLSAFHFANYQALLATAVTDASGDATIALGSHTLTLDHVQKADLHSDLFHL